MTLVIAELGANPSPDWNLREYIETAALCGADAAKVQLWRADHFPETEREEKARQQFPRQRFPEFVKLTRANKMRAGASAFDEAATEMLRHGDFGKLALREFWNVELFTAASRSIYPLFVSAPILHPGRNRLGCIAEYPTPLWKAMLGLVVWACGSRRFKFWGWSSHTTSIWDCVWAARLGASVIEKHFALHETDCEAGHSLLPADFARMTGRIHGQRLHA